MGFISCFALSAADLFLVGLIVVAILCLIVLIFSYFQLKKTLELNSPFKSTQVVKMNNFESEYDIQSPPEEYKTACKEVFDLGLKSHEISKSIYIQYEVWREENKLFLKETANIYTHYRKNPIVSLVFEPLIQAKGSLTPKIRAISSVDILPDNQHFSKLFKNVLKLSSSTQFLFLKATHKLDTNPYLILVLSLENTNQLVSGKFSREISALLSLKHRNILEYKTSWVEENSLFEQKSGLSLFIQFDYLSFITLRKYLNCRKKASKTHIQGIFLQILSALNYLEHQTSFLLPIGLDSILIDRQGTVKLLAFYACGVEENASLLCLHYKSYLELSLVLLESLLEETDCLDSMLLDEIKSLLQSNGSVKDLMNSEELKQWTKMYL